MNKGELYPVERVCLEDIELFLDTLKETTGVSFSLPSSYQWEYACSMGYTAMEIWQREGLDIDDYALYQQNSAGHTGLVGQKKENHWGLADMHGQVWELCTQKSVSALDIVDETFYGDILVLRGGNVYSTAQDCSSLSILKWSENQNKVYGFRIVAWASSLDSLR
jgi:formylglycine-generating enzyme required for sulfatase activity